MEGTDNWYINSEINVSNQLTCLRFKGNSFLLKSQCSQIREEFGPFADNLSSKY